MWPRVQLCRVRTRAAAVSSWVAGGGALDSWMKVRVSRAHGDPARFVQAPVLVSRPCTPIPAGDCCWAFCMSCSSSWMYAPGSRFSPVPVIRLSVSLNSRYRVHVGRWYAGAAACSTRWMLSCSGSLSRSMGSCFAEMSRPLGLWEGWILGSGFASQRRMFQLTQIMVLHVCGPLARVAVLSPWPTAPFEVPA